MNGLLLLLVTFVPFPTSLVAAYLGGPEEKTAVVVYSGTFLWIGFFYNALWHYACYNRRLLSQTVDMRRVAAITRQYLFGPLLYGAAFAMAFYQGRLSLLICFGLAVFFALPEKVKG